MLKKILKVIAFIAITLTLIPIFAFDFWWIRMFDFPHVQLTVITLLAILIYYIKFSFKSYGDLAIISILITCFAFQVYKVRMFMPFYESEVKSEKLTDTSKSISFLTSNVLQSNDNYDLLKNVIDSTDADIMLFTEVNEKWSNYIKKQLRGSHAYMIGVPLDNTYGMLLCSKNELINPEIKYLVGDSIPSIHTKIKLDNQQLIQFYGLHPTPPMPQHNPKSTQRDAEFMIIADLKRNNRLPVLVLGDFNDVPWSGTMKLFKAYSELLDPRIGRGFYNTFSTKSKLLRWPLDHIFVSEEFRLIEYKNCTSIKSDHFPLYSKLVFSPENAHEQKPKQASKSIIERAQKQIEKLKN
ncbi:endonuclease/exonuclease/phosphatase family protein [Aurantibacter aestuarii]|uniref:Endonuclease/exonuclease/phosphatase family protein n=1 Tax=Aurantibacter aestuarii TaxID=1266046 RepID=A0A2T1N8U5_9FLAO|nr:endonuclease/exonuclease/phosphatase family protein [Aurantibacter aestuarii]PSG88281.1 endonuclease/exonuclease/phosphatase family protein [Aurantibacter aestuarii]